MKIRTGGTTGAFQLIAVVTVLAIGLNFVSGNRMTKLATDYFTIHWEEEKIDTIGNDDNAETLHEERIKELENRIDEYERQQREKELEDKIAELENRLEHKKRHEQRKNEKFIKSTKKEVDLNGTWQNRVNNVMYRIHQYDNLISFQEIELLYGIETVTAVGEGEIVDGKLLVKYQTIYTTNGKAELKIGTDNNRMSGFSKDLVTDSQTILKLIKLGS
jgi:hypothetical protein